MKLFYNLGRNDSVRIEERTRLACAGRRPAGQPGRDDYAPPDLEARPAKPLARRQGRQPGRLRSPFSSGSFRSGRITQALGLVAVLLLPVIATAAESSAARKPVLLYSRYFNAEGETRYLPDGTFKDVLGWLSGHFDLRIHNQPLTPQTLAGVNAVLIANPSDKAVGNGKPPPHVSAKDVETLSRFVEGGGGLIIMGNQENHNLEIDDVNKLMARFGIQFTNLYTDAKQLVVPKDTPVIGGLRWAYYTGNLLLLDAKHPAKPRSLVTNDLKVKPLGGPRDQAGCLLGVAEPGKGRVVAVTDSGWIIDDALSGKGIGPVTMNEQDNWEIFQRLAGWAAGVEEKKK